MTAGGGRTRVEAREGVTVGRRYMQLPRYLRTVHGRAELVRVLEEVAEGLGLTRLCAVSGSSVTRALASDLVAELAVAGSSPLSVPDNSEAQVELLASALETQGAEGVLAVGGGKTIDVAKSACELSDVPVIVVPTQLTADGIASPVSVIRTHSGEVSSRRARLPVAVAVDLDVIVDSPVESARAGLGDLLANPCALDDWRRAAAAGEEQVDDFAALLARAASDLVYATEITSLGEGRLELDFAHRLLQGLVLSGLAMEVAGSSRPCSGAEHLVSHAIDRLHPGSARHGEQVAFGAVLCSYLQGADWGALRQFLVRAGMERAACGLGLSVDEVVAVLRAAPSTRPGRYTVLNETELADEALRPVVRELLGR